MKLITLALLIPLCAMGQGTTVTSNLVGVVDFTQPDGSAWEAWHWEVVAPRPKPLHLPLLTGRTNVAQRIVATPIWEQPVMCRVVVAWVPAQGGSAEFNKFYSKSIKTTNEWVRVYPIDEDATKGRATLMLDLSVPTEAKIVPVSGAGEEGEASITKLAPHVPPKPLKGFQVFTVHRLSDEEMHRSRRMTPMVPPLP